MAVTPTLGLTLGADYDADWTNFINVNASTIDAYVTLITNGGLYRDASNNMGVKVDNATIELSGTGELKIKSLPVLLNDVYLKARNSSDTGDLDLIKLDNTDAVVIGSGTVGVKIPSALASDLNMGTNKILVDSYEGIYDQSSQKLLEFLSIPSAVNFLGVVNHPAGGAPTLYVDGTDTNIDLLVDPKGAGYLSAPRLKLTSNSLEIAYGGTGAATAQAGFDNLSPAISRGDVIVHNGANNARLPLGTNGQVLTSNGTDVVWSDSAAPGALLASNNLSDVANIATSRTNLGLGTAATQNVGTFLQTANNLSDVTASTARTNLGLGAAATRADNYFVNTSEYTAKGDLLIGTAAGTKTALALGTDTYVLTADSTQPSGVKWAASGGGGGSSTFAGLSDVAITSAANDDTLRYNSATSKWVNNANLKITSDGKIGMYAAPTDDFHITKSGTNTTNPIMTVENTNALSGESNTSYAVLRLKVAHTSSRGQIEFINPSATSAITLGRYSDQLLIASGNNLAANVRFNINAAGRVQIGANTTFTATSFQFYVSNTSGSSTSHVFENTHASGNSYVRVKSATNPVYYATKGTTFTWGWGLDSGDSDKFKIGYSPGVDTLFGTNDCLTIDTSGTVNAVTALTVNGSAVVKKSDYTAKGVLLAGNGSGTTSTIAAGTNGYVLTADSTVAGGVKWAAGGGGGGFANPATAELNMNAYAIRFNTGYGISDSNGNKQLTFTLASSAVNWLDVKNSSAGSPVTMSASGSDANLGFDIVTKGTGTFRVSPDGTPRLYVDSTGVYTAGGVNSTVIGKGALGSITTGSQNTAFGFQSLGSLTTGTFNTAFGLNAGFYNATGNYNTAIGHSALTGTTGQPVSTGQTAVGHSALSKSYGQYNTAVGQNAGKLITNGLNNVIIGNDAMLNCTNVQDNVAIGYSAAKSMTGYKNVYIGSGSCQAVTGAYNNVGVGYQSLSAVTSGDGVTSVGSNSLIALTTGSQNTAIGYNSLSSLTTSAFNTALGWGSGQAFTGEQNTLIGHQSGDGSNGSYNTYIGKSSGINSTGSYNTALGMNTGPASGQTAAFNSTAIGAGAQWGGSNQIRLGSAAETVYTQNSVVTTSDERLKENIVDSDLGLSFINQLRPVKYNFKDSIVPGLKDSDGNVLIEERTVTHKRPHYGLIAQDVKSVIDGIGIDFAGYIDQSISGGIDQKNLRYEEFISPLIKAVQELSVKNAELESRLAALESTGE